MTYHLLTALFFFLGAYSIAGQVYFIRELLVIFFGNELCLGIIFAGWFAGIGLGAVMGGRSSKKTDHIMTILLLSLVVFALLPFLLIPIMRMARAILQIPAGGYASIAHVAGGTLISICPFSFMVGFIFPVACRVLIGRRGQGSIEIGWVYLWESVGSLAGGLIVSLWLIPRYSPIHVFGWGAFLIFATSFLLSCRYQKVFRAIKVLLFVLSLASSVAFMSGALNGFNEYLVVARWNTFNTGQRFIESRDSRYQNIVLSESQDQYGVFVNGSYYDVYPNEYQAAIKAHFFLSQHPDPRKVLLIGGGITGLLKEILKHPVDSLDYIEFDSELVKMLYPLLKTDDRLAADNKRVTIFYMDGRRYVKESGRKYDLIIIDTPDPSTALLNRYYTIEFFEEVRKILSEKGVVVLGLSSTVNYVSPEIADYNGSLYRGLKSVFPFVMVVPGERNYFFGGTQNGLFTKDPAVLAGRYEERRIITKNFSAALFDWLIQKDRIEFMEDALNEKGAQLLNTDFHPVTYFYNLVIWDIISGEKDRLSIFQKMKGEGIWWVLVPAGLFFILGCAAIAAKRSGNMLRFNIFWVIGTTGCGAMAVEIVLIFMFQSLYGYIYEKIGIVAALFMMGIAIGSHIMRNRLKIGRWSKLENLIVLEMIICVYVFVLPFVLHAFAGTLQIGKGLFLSTEYFYFFLIVVIGLIAGMEFPLVCHLLISSGYESSYVAGRVDAIDHMGACFGSFFPGIILLPLFGIENTCFIIALLKSTCICFLVMASKYNWHKRA